jgi:hypothetical protein
LRKRLGEICIAVAGWEDWRHPTFERHPDKWMKKPEGVCRNGVEEIYLSLLTNIHEKGASQKSFSISNHTVLLSRVQVTISY